MSGVFDNLSGQTWGLWVKNKIHTRGVNVDIIKHETNHHLFNQVNPTAPLFLSEGIQKWYEYYESPRKRDKGLATAIEFKEEDLAP